MPMKGTRQQIVVRADCIAPCSWDAVDDEGDEGHILKLVREHLEFKATKSESYHHMVFVSIETSTIYWT